MTTTADPYVVPLPEKISEQDGSPSDEFKNWLVYDNRFKHDLWQQSGGGEDLFIDLQNQITSNDADITTLQAVDVALDARLDILESLSGLTVTSESSNYTTSGNTIVRASDSILITLNPTPSDREYVTVYHDGGPSDIVTVTDGTSTDTLTQSNTVVTYTYYSTLSKWVP